MTTLDPAWIIYTLRDLKAFAEEHCRTEVAFHLDAAQRHVAPYISKDPPVEVPDPAAQAAKDVVNDLIKFAKTHNLAEMRVHLLAARRKLLKEEAPEVAMSQVVTFPIARPKVAKRKVP